MLGEASRAFAGDLQSFPGNGRPLDGHASRLEEARDCVQDPSPVPSATKDPRQLSQHQEWNEHFACGTRLRKSGTRFAGLRGLIVEVGAGPHVGVGCKHYHRLPVLAEFSSWAPGFAPRSCSLSLYYLHNHTQQGTLNDHTDLRQLNVCLAGRAHDRGRRPALYGNG